MIARKTITALSLPCILLICMLFGSSASAAGGTTLVTCKKGGTTLDFKGPHCSLNDIAGLGNGSFSHFQVANGTPTATSSTNGNTKNETKEATPWVLRSTLGGVEFEVACSSSAGTGEITNVERLFEQHEVRVQNLQSTYTGCAVSKPAGQECKVKEGKIQTQLLNGESFSTSMLFAPASGTKIAGVVIEKCKTSSLNGAKELTGQVQAGPNGATWNVNIPKSVESTLVFGGQKAGLTSSETIKGKRVGGTETAESLSVTFTPLVLGG
jgi:hypothetical protein